MAENVFSNLYGAATDPQVRRDIRQGLIDALNRGMVAQTFGAPADLGNLLANALRAGYGTVGKATGLLSTDQMPELETKPFLGSEWLGDKMRQAGAVSENRNPMAEMLAGGLLVPATTAQLSAKAPAIASGLLRADEAAKAGAMAVGQKGSQVAENYMARQGLLQPATVWHGSPHKFDKFDSSKIGTGEGAQAYGHGLYFASNESVGQGYKHDLSPKYRAFAINGDEVPDPSYIRGIVSSVYNEMNPKPRMFGGAPTPKSADEAISHLISKHRQNIETSTGNAALIEQNQNAIDALQNLRGKQITGSVEIDGHLYKVDLPDNAIARMLDWDKPLSQQAPEVRSALSKHIEGMRWEPPRGDQNWALKRPDGSTMLWRSEREGGGSNVQDFVGNLSGENLYKLFKGKSADEVSSTLRQAGIPGIRYLDQGSRGSGQGTSNYVVFPGEESLLQILERNGQPVR
jgi:hypothetical protein